jgi:hypothetical protein
MKHEPCPTSAFTIAAAFYREARAAAAKPGSGNLILGDQAGGGWISVLATCRELGEWIDARACEIVDFDSASTCWAYFWDDAPEVAALFAAVDTSWPPASPVWVALLDATIARHFPLL